MKRKSITIVFKNCRDDVARTFLIDMKQNIQAYKRCNRQDFTKRKSNITIRGLSEKQADVTDE